MAKEVCTHHKTKTKTLTLHVCGMLITRLVPAEIQYGFPQSGMSLVQTSAGKEFEVETEPKARMDK